MSGSSSLWYEQTENVDRLLNGVFEGGGAKGIAYAGALLALKARGCWFASVAGTSAGSITAALVAAGFKPNEIQEMAPRALKTVRPFRTLMQRILIPMMGYGFYSKESLEEWLRNTLSKRLDDLGASSYDPNFKELFDATNIELNVVATSLSLKSPVVFSHLETPQCSVAAAVAASAAIPFAFSDSRLEVNDDGKIWHQTIVDGGVWVNFPWFVYTDCQFRRLYERSPEDLPAFVITSMLFMFGSITAWLIPWWWSTGVLLKLVATALWAVAFLAVLLVVESILLIFLAAFFLNQPLRRVGYGLATTFFDASGAPEWTATDDRIIHLPVSGVATTDFDMDTKVQESLIERAMKETHVGLTKLGIPTQDVRNQTDL
jgi:hypothetical protein